MTGEEVLKAADLLRAWRHLRKLRIQLHDASCFHDAYDIVHGSIGESVFGEFKLAADLKIDALIQATIDEAALLDVHPPFPVEP